MSRQVTEDSRAALAVAVRKLCPPWLADQHDDLVQMAVMKILRGSGTGPLTKAYLHRVAYSVVIDEIRRLKRRNEVAMSPSMPDRIANSNDLSPETRARGAEIGEQLVAALAELIPTRRRAVVLYLQDLSIPEIARRLGIPRKTASNLTYRGLDDLKATLRERGVDP